MPTLVKSAALRGVEAEIVTIEVQVVNGLPGTTIIGLPDSVVKESRDRVKAAIQNSGFSYPDRKILVNLAPAHLRKEGPGFDLAIALGVLAEQGWIPAQALQGFLFLGELSLEGSLHSIRGMIAAGSAAASHRIPRVLVPEEAREEARWIDAKEVYSASSLSSVARFLLQQEVLTPLSGPSPAKLAPSLENEDEMQDVRGQWAAKRALLIAAAGEHNTLFIGPPGTGKTMLAKRLPKLLPQPRLDEAREILQIQGIVRPLSAPKYPRRPFRSPHHSLSLTGLTGGGPRARPGEMTLAHRGVLFLDELPEFHRDLLEALRQPLEEGAIEIGRANYHLRFPADFMLLGAMNPCPCGFHGHPLKACRCYPSQIRNYRSRISGPLLDRIDLQVELGPLNEDTKSSRNSPSAQSSEEYRQCVEKARAVQEKRFRGRRFQTNGRIPSPRLKEYCALDSENERFLQHSLKALQLSQRAYDRCLRVSRTIADLEGNPRIEKAHLAEAIGYRCLDRTFAANF